MVWSGLTGTTALVMELVEGPTLADRIAQGPIPIDEALPIAKQIAEALEAAHEQGIIHRDLKPANIKVRPDGTVKVLDFGLAKAMEPAVRPSPNVSQSPTITTPAMMTRRRCDSGTAAYMSPEQARGSTVDKRADLWALGVVLWEMLTGKRAVRRRTVSDTLAAVLRAEPDWNALAPATPAAIRRLLRRCLEKDRKRRLDSAADARLEIEEAASESTEMARTVLPARAGRREAVAWGLAGFAIAAAVGLSVWQVSTRPAAAPVVASQFVVPPPKNLVYRDVPAISPDGRTIAFVASDTDGRSRLLDAAAGPVGSAGADRHRGSSSAVLVARQSSRRVFLTGGVEEGGCLWRDHHSVWPRSLPVS